MFYLNSVKSIIVRSRDWISLSAKIALVFFLCGTLFGLVSYYFYPSAGESLLQTIHSGFEQVLPDEVFGLNFQSLQAIFLQNFQAAMIAMFLGFVLGLVSTFLLAVNFFIIGFLFTVVLIGGGAEIFFLSTTFHGIVELPIMIVTAGFGLKLGYFFKNPDPELGFFQKFIVQIRENLYLVPFVGLILFIAAFIEVYITGGILIWLGYI